MTARHGQRDSDLVSCGWEGTGKLEPQGIEVESGCLAQAVGSALEAYSAPSVMPPMPTDDW